MNRVTGVVGALGAWIAYDSLLEIGDRNVNYRLARAYCNRVRKPLLNIGCPSSRPMAYPCGDVCLDVASGRLRSCRAARRVVGDVRQLSGFRDKEFGAVTCFHVIEHLPTISDAKQAIRELQRVADSVFILSPSRFQPLAWLHPDHYLWVDQQADGDIRLFQRKRGVKNQEALYPLLKSLWSAGEAVMRTFGTSQPFGQTFREEMGQHGIVEANR